LIESEGLLDLREVVENPEEGQLIHFHLVYLRAHIGEHVVLAGKLHFQVLVLLEQVLDDLILLCLLLLLDHQVVLHQALVDDIDLLARGIIHNKAGAALSGRGALVFRTALHLLELLDKGLLRDVNLVPQACQGFQVVVVAVVTGLKGAAEVLWGLSNEIVIKEELGVHPPLF
jgi:hypothetical protein